MNKEYWDIIISIVSILSIFVLVGSVIYIGYERRQVKSDIVDTINVPDGYSIEAAGWFQFEKMDGDWYRWIMWFKKPNYVCMEDEMIDEPWKCEDFTFDRQSATIWYNTETKKMYQEAGSVDVL